MTDFERLAEVTATEPSYTPSPIGIALFAAVVVLTVSVITVPQSRLIASCLLMLVLLAMRLRLKGVVNQP